MQNATNSKIVLTLFITLAVVGGLIVFIVRPQVAGLTATREEIVKNRNELADLRGQANALSQALAELNRVASQKEKIGNLFPTREEMERVVIGLEAAAESAGVSMTLSITDRLEQPPQLRKDNATITGLSGLEEVPFVLDFSANYREMLDFFLHFDHAPFLTKIMNLSVIAQTLTGVDKESIVNSGSASIRARGIFFMRNNP